MRTRSPVDRIRIENGRVAGVVLGKTGQEIDAKVVVSNADLKRTILDLVGESRFAPETVKRVRSFRMATPLFCVYLGLDVDLAAQGIPNTNRFFIGTYDIEGIYDRIDAGEIPADSVAYVTAATLKDPVSRHFAPKGYTSLQIMTVAPGDHEIWNLDRSPAEGGRYHRDAGVPPAKAGGDGPDDRDRRAGAARNQWAHRLEGGGEPRDPRSVSRARLVGPPTESH